MWGDTMDIKKAMQLYELRAYLEEKKAEQEVIEERYNKYHDPRNGRFTNGSGGGGGSVLVIPKGHAGVYRGHKAAMQKSMSAANEQAAQRIQALGGNVNENGNYSFQEHGGLQMFAGQSTAQPTTTIDINTGNVTQQTGNVAPQATNSGNGLTNEKIGSTIENKEYGDMSGVLDRAAAKNIEYREIRKLDRELTEQEIIDKIGGGDKTSGSCASLALAYAANKAGYDVTDYRGGESQKLFADGFTWVNIGTGMGDKSDFDDVFAVGSVRSKTLDMIKAKPDGKEYILASGKHAAIVRHNGKNVEYLELQRDPSFARIYADKQANGWKKLNCAKLGRRFGVDSSMGHSRIISVEDIAKTDGFAKMMGYINTAPDKQRKGVGGGER